MQSVWGQSGTFVSHAVKIHLSNMTGGLLHPPLPLICYDRGVLLKRVLHHVALTSANSVAAAEQWLTAGC